MDRSRTTCSEDLYASDEELAVDYDVMESEGETVWYFGQSGTEAGVGFTDESGEVWISAPWCSWF